MAKILVTGAAGFIGFHCVKSLLNAGHKVVGIDNINNYYDPRLKLQRLCSFSSTKLESFSLADKVSVTENFDFVKLDLLNKAGLELLFKENEFEYVINLAAQVGVRNSIENPYDYINSNVTGFLNLLELIREVGIKHLLFASSSSVYGANEKIPFNESDAIDHPISLYASTKRMNELMAHNYAHLFGIPCTGLRFFTVYGPWGRPDMAAFLFMNAIHEGKPISVFNNGNMRRDFTYVADVCDAISKLLLTIPKLDSTGFSNPDKSNAPYQIFNVGNSSPVSLMDFIGAIEKSLNKKAILDFKPLQKGDLITTFAGTDKLEKELNWKPETSLQDGMDSMTNWYLNCYLNNFATINE